MSKIYQLSDQEIKKIEQAIGYSFNNHTLLIESLLHPSVKQQNADGKDNERMELLGDSILSFVITENLFKNHTQYDEGKLAKIRSFLVCKDTLSEIARELNLADFIIMTQGEELAGGRSNPNNLENTLEAIIAAIYLDSDITVIRSIILNIWAKLLSNPNYSDSDPKTTLQEWVQEYFETKPIYTVIEKSGPAHSPIFTVSARVNQHTQIGHGSSIKAAEKEAAKKLIILLDIKSND